MNSSAGVGNLARRHTEAHFLREYTCPMAQPQPTRLREVDPAPVDDARVIDADYKIVGRKRRALRVFWGALVAIFWAAVIGFLIPPAWIFFEGIGEFFAAN